MVSRTKQLTVHKFPWGNSTEQSYKSSIKLPNKLVTGEKHCGLPVHLTYNGKLIQLPYCSNAF
jgi:hypothetical protein